MAALSDYLTDTRALLRDASASLYSTPDLTSFINKAMQKRDILSRALRVRISYPMTASVFEYPFSTIVSGGTVLTGPASPNVVNLLSVIRKVNTGGLTTSGVRVPLGRKPYSWLAWLLSTSFPTQPMYYAVYGPGSAGRVFIGPPPAQAYPTEWDFFCFSTALVGLADTDPCPYPYTEPIPWVAAARAKMQAQRFDEAKAFYDLALANTNFALVGANPLSVANPWSDLPGANR